MKKIAISLITLYQKTLSPDHGVFRARYPHGFCKFYPSCSEYTKQAIEKFGIIKGAGMGILRILRCNPFTQPRIDKVH
jgi:uncharacterized protein